MFRFATMRIAVEPLASREAPMTFTRRRMWRSIRSLLALAMLATIDAGVSPAAASPPGWRAGVRAGTVQEGQQHTLQSGFELGLQMDRVTGSTVDIGLGLGFVLDPGGGSHERDRVTVMSIETHMRTSTERPRPYLELGLGYYWIDRNPSDPSLPGSAAQGGVGGFAGLGVDFQPAGDTGPRVGIGVAYHLIAAEVSYSGGNAEDYWTLAGTLRWGAH
jgi:hypothetical protein